MSRAGADWLDAAKLRREFDRTFEQPPPGARSSLVDLLIVRVAEHAYALDLAELSALHADRKIAPAPSKHPALLGLVGLRGVVVPAYDLGRILGYRRAFVPRFLVRLRAAALALGFDVLERQLRVETSALVNQTREGAMVGGVVETPELGPVAILDLSRIRAQIAAQTGHGQSTAT